MVNLDEWFPNFDFLIMKVLPTLILLTMAIILLQYWLSRRRKRERPESLDWMDVLTWGTALYLIVPIYRIFEFLMGRKSFSDLVEELFVTDFRNYMMLCLLVGIFGLFFILKRKFEDQRTSGGVRR